MSEKPNHNKQYSVAEIQAYLDGRMSSKEMHDLEKAALDDPFLADAIEGVQAARSEYTDNIINQHLQKTEEALADRLKQPAVRRIGFWGWRQMAAAALVLVIAGVWMYKNYQESDKPSGEIALEPTKTPSITTTPVDKSNHDTLATTAANLPKAAAPKNILEDKSFERKEQLDKDDYNKRYSVVKDKEARERELDNKSFPASGAAKETAASQIHDNVVSNDTISDKLTVNDGEIREKVAVKPAQMNVLKNAVMNRFNGRVLDPNRKPLAFASVSIYNQKSGVTTDQNGFFSFAATDSILTVNVASIGYVSQNFQLTHNNALNQLTLTPSDNNLSEVVVTSAGAKRKSRTDYFSRNPRVLIQDAEPVIGWIEYQKYLDAGNTLRDTTSDEDVVVSFVVDKAGKLGNFKIEQSLSEKADAEALRLIKEGPAWHVLKGRKARVIVMVRF